MESKVKDQFHAKTINGNNMSLLSYLCLKQTESFPYSIRAVMFSQIKKNLLQYKFAFFDSGSTRECFQRERSGTSIH